MDAAFDESGSVAAFRNRLLRALPAETLAYLTPLLKRVTLRRQQLLHASRTPMERVYFIERGVISVFGGSGRRKQVEAWSIGVEGMSGIEILLEDDHPPLQRIVQVEGEAWQLQRQDFASITQRAEIRRLLLRYTMFVALQTVQIGICNATHSAEQRLSRWLLQARHALGEHAVPLTHRAMARILGVRRATVTDALGALEQRGAIRVSRGAVLIDDLEKLNQRACGCGRMIAREYQRLVGDPGAVQDDLEWQSSTPALLIDA
jgi:CRP-like cAMP-binding protein